MKVKNGFRSASAAIEELPQVERQRALQDQEDDDEDGGDGGGEIGPQFPPGDDEGGTRHQAASGMVRARNTSSSLPDGCCRCQRLRRGVRNDPPIAR